MRAQTNLPKTVVAISQPSILPIIDMDLKWAPTITTTTTDLIQVIYAMDYFIAIDSTGNILYSIDGRSWNKIRIGDFVPTYLVYINDRIIVTGYSLPSTSSTTSAAGIIAMSTDIFHWEIKEVLSDTTRKNLRFWGISWNGNRYIIPLSYGTGSGSGDMKSISFAYTEDFITFAYCTNKCSNADDGIMVAIGNGRMVISAIDNTAVMKKKYILVTADGETADYSTRSAVESSLLFFGGYFIQFTSTEILVSFNAIDWQSFRRADLPDESSNMYISVIGIKDAVLLLDGQGNFKLVHDISDVWQTAGYNYSFSTISCSLKSMAKSDKILVASGSSGIFFTADITDEGKGILTIIPDTIDKEIPVFEKDAVKLIKVRAVDRNIDDNIQPENIKDGISILGVDGTYHG